ncbi:hypothetical protein FOA52_010615 [Chlamydomonas sp. UWO 241]|nr:hypothetical protein FOA52_010615 [Chlamydomonas sp. UWO 241]
MTTTKTKTPTKFPAETRSSGGSSSSSSSSSSINNNDSSSSSGGGSSSSNKNKNKNKNKNENKNKNKNQNNKNNNNNNNNNDDKNNKKNKISRRDLNAQASPCRRAPDPSAQAALLEGSALIGKEASADEAMQLFDQVTRTCPSYAEGYNKKATLLYLTRQFRDSIAQCLIALELQPYHFGAASGMGLCHLQLGEYPEAVAAFNIALSINPTLIDISNIHAGLKKTLAEAAAKAAAAGGEQAGGGGGGGSSGSVSGGRGT